MKILTTSDWHIGNFRSPVKDGVNLRTEDTKRCLDEIVRVAREEAPDYVLVSGDIFDNAEVRQGRGHREALQARHVIMELSRTAGQVVVMRGTPNHDPIEAFEELQAHFEHVANVHVITLPQVLSFEDADIAVVPGFDRGIYRAKSPGLSSVEENEVFTQELSNIVLGLRALCRPGTKKILMAHYTVPGCNMESGQVRMLTQFEPVIPQEALMAAGYDLVALGHIHRPQRLMGHDWFYSGAVNQMNFNDEGQERGFWIHMDMPSGGWDSRFHNTPVREHITFGLTDTDITAINLGHMDEVACNYWRYNGAVKDKIVRIHYSCSAENGKALNRTLLSQALLDDGAFMVWEILPDQVTEIANRTELAGATDPEANLIRYLEEKQVPPEKIQELVLKARPIIAEAEAGMPTAENSGTFEPVEISVKNYRNYEDETFNFEDITFCTINGANGAGKSSLFMDAIIDCLYEEPREGALKDDGGKPMWLRNEESVRSGSIMFTFRIGEKKYRVTRTRARSGGVTLNISRFTDGGWEDCSKERANDTQQEILNIIGMDSFTFKSCALIMQDQYGLFLQAKPEERVEVLGTLLRLGVYQSMERIAQDKARVCGAKKREMQQEIEIHQGTISGFGNPGEEMERCQTEIDGCEDILRAKTEERDKNRLLLATRQEAAERREKLLASITALNMKKAAAEQNRANQQAIADSSAIILSSKAEIEAKAAEHKALLERELELAGESALYSSKKREAENLARQAALEQKSIDAFKAKVEQKENELSWAQPTAEDEEVAEKAGEYAEAKGELEALQEKAVCYQQAKTEYSAAAFHHDEATRKFDAEVHKADEQKKVLEKKVEILKESGCVDIENAHCRFLQDAIEAKEQLAAHESVYADIASRRELELAKTKQELDEKYGQMMEIGFDEAALTALQSKCASLFPYVAKMEAIRRREGQIALLKADIGHLQSNISDAEKRLSEVKLKGIETEMERDRYAKAFEEHVQTLTLLHSLEPWIEKQKQLPVAQERHATAMNRIAEIGIELAGIEAEIAEKQTDAEKETLAMSGMETLERIDRDLNADIDSLGAALKEKQMQIGALRQKAEQIAKLKNEIAELQEKHMEYARETADYDALKTAFSQRGVPHQIIRSIIPQLTATANTILGQMTGGKMGVEFRLERMQKNRTEKVSLDIYIEEYGKSVLPYLSKSGGEKVKSSLSVILALAEIKSASAGIRLGMLFIDEAPFLDSDGVQAYVDALETIQRRYSDIKVMAITHDPTFKARFPQGITIEKDENGSHVRWD